MKSLLSGTSGIRLIGSDVGYEVWHGSFYGSTMTVDAIAADPPWRQGNLSYWSRQAGCEQQWSVFVDELIGLVARSKPMVVYLKVGLRESLEWENRLRQVYRQTTRWETSYYAGKNAQVVASTDIPLDGLPKEIKSPEATTKIADWMWSCGIKSIGDCCGGKGEMLAKFYRAGMDVVATELVESRSKICLKKLAGCKR